MKNRKFTKDFFLIAHKEKLKYITSGKNLKLFTSFILNKHFYCCATYMKYNQFKA